MRVSDFPLLALATLMVATVGGFCVLSFPFPMTVCDRGTLQSLSMNTVSRRDYLSFVASSLFPLVAFVQPTSADVTNKVASSAALKSVRRALKELEDMEALVGEKDYDGVRSALRVPPFTEVRKNCVILIRGAEDSMEAGSLERTYADFKTSIEALDSQAGLGTRGRKGVDMTDSFAASVKSLNNFLDVADRAVQIPIQYTNQ